MAEGHVRSALSTITASMMPDDFIDPEWVASFGLMAQDLWVSGSGLVDNLFRVQLGLADLAPQRLLMDLAQAGLEDATNSYLDLLRGLINRNAFNPIKPPTVLGEFNLGSIVQYGDVRGLLVKLGGGTSSPEVQLMGGVTTGQTVQTYLGYSGIATNEKIWLYGWEEQPRRTFNGHLQMDGLVFEEWDDNGLIIAPQDKWLRRNYYAPGDHWGCACVVAPYFPNFGAPFEI